MENHWKHELILTKDGKIKNLFINVITILENDSGLKNSFVLKNQDHKLIEITEKGLPWRKRTDRRKFWDDCDSSFLRSYLERNYGMNCNKINTSKPLRLVALINAGIYRPTKEWID